MNMIKSTSTVIGGLIAVITLFVAMFLIGGVVTLPFAALLAVGTAAAAEGETEVSAPHSRGSKRSEGKATGTQNG